MKKLIMVLIAFVFVIAAGTWLGPWTAEYEVKTAAKMSCNDRIKEKQGFGDLKSDETFIKKANVAGVRLKPGQFAFSVEEKRNLGLWSCHYKVAWKSSSAVFLIGDFLPDVPPLNLVHRLDAFHEIKSSY